MKSSGDLREKRGTIECVITRTTEGGKHQVINTIDECHVQIQDEADKATGQEYDWSRKVDPQEFPLAKLDVGSKVATSIQSLFRIARSLIVSHANDRGIRLIHEWDRQDGKDSAERGDNLSGVSFISQMKACCVLMNTYLYPMVCTTKLR